MKCEKCGQEVKALKVGDRVEAIGENNGGRLKGERGVVKVIDNGVPPVLVEFDKAFGQGHNGEGHCKQGHGWWGQHEDFRVIKAARKGVK